MKKRREGLHSDSKERRKLATSLLFPEAFIPTYPYWPLLQSKGLQGVEPHCAFGNSEERRSFSSSKNVACKMLIYKTFLEFILITRLLLQVVIK